MSAAISAHDRAQAWYFLRRRAQASPVALSRVPVIDEAIGFAAVTERFDPLLSEDCVADWNAHTEDLHNVVTAALRVRYPGNDELVGSHAWMHLYDWLMLPSDGAMQAFVDGSLALRHRWWLRRNLFHQAHGTETFYSDNTLRVVLRDVGPHTGEIIMADMIDFWSHRPGFTTVSAVTDSRGELVVLDHEARIKNLIPPPLLADIAHVCRLWGTLLSEYRYHADSLNTQLSRQRVKPFPGT